MVEDSSDHLSPADNLVKGYLILIETYHKLHQSGFSDWKGMFTFEDIGQEAVNQSILQKIQDPKLLKSIQSLQQYVVQMTQLDTKISNWLESYVGCSLTNNLKQFERKLRQIVTNSQDGGPIWILHHEYKSLLKESERIFLNSSAAMEQFNKRLEQIRS